MNIKKVIIIIVVIIFPGTFLCQSDTSAVNQDKMIYNPSYWGIQIEAISILVSSEVGALVDYDIYSSPSKKYNFGIRFSTEYYDQTSVDVGGKSAPGPFWDFNIYGRHSIRGRSFWFSPLIGLSIHNKLEEVNSESKLILKWGLEAKYNLLGDNLGLIFKFALAFKGESGYMGLGFSYGLYQNK